MSYLKRFAVLAVAAACLGLTAAVAEADHERGGSSVVILADMGLCC